jgi:putative copper export protein
MGPRLRKVVLTAHVVSAAGWIGAVAAYLVLALAGSTSDSAETVRAAFIAMELLYFALVPLAAVALLTGLAQALGTNWGLLRRYWVLAKFVLTAVAFTVMMFNLDTVSSHADHVRHSPAADLPGAGHDLQHAVGGLVILLVAAILGIYKPGGLTRYGRRKKRQLA